MSMDYQQITDFANDLLKLKGAELYFTYDTAFTQGDFYFSILLVRNVLFQSFPALPLMSMIHKKKSNDL